MDFEKITIVGLGLIGGSLAWALKESGEVRRVIGVDSDAEAIDYAERNGIIDAGTLDVNEGVCEANIVVIATHVSKITPLAKAISLSAQVGTVITDVGSVKSKIVYDVQSVTPPGVLFIGGHPIAGTERSGVWNSDKGLFQNRHTILTPTKKTRPQAVEKIRGMWELVGAEVLEMSPNEHDRIFGLVSHLPHVVAYALVNTVVASDRDGSALKMAGGGLRDFTRIAESSPEMWTDILLMNRDKVLESLRDFKTVISNIEKMVEEGDAEGLAQEFEKSKDAKKEF